jgi:hypothetical protein
MPRLSRELIFARHLSFEAWPDVGRERPTTSNYIFGAVCPKEGHGAALNPGRLQCQGNKYLHLLEIAQTVAMSRALRLAARKHSRRISRIPDNRRMIGCRSRASIAPNHCRQVQSLDYSTTKRAWCFSGSHSSTDDGFKSGLDRVRPATEPVLPSRRIGRLLRSSSSMPIAALRSARLKKRTWRNRAKIQRSTISTAPYRSGSSYVRGAYPP